MADVKSTNAPPVNPRYRAPEALTDANAHTKASDIFMFGCIMWEVFTRTKAFHWLAQPNELQKMLNERWNLKAEERTAVNCHERLETDVRIRIPERALELMLRCLQDNPELRPKIEEIREELNKMFLNECYLNPDVDRGMVAMPELPIKRSKIV